MSDSPDFAPSRPLARDLRVDSELPRRHPGPRSPQASDRGLTPTITERVVAISTSSPQAAALGLGAANGLGGFDGIPAILKIETIVTRGNEEWPTGTARTHHVGPDDLAPWAGGRVREIPVPTTVGTDYYSKDEPPLASQLAPGDLLSCYAGNPTFGNENLQKAADAGNPHAAKILERMVKEEAEHGPMRVINVTDHGDQRVKILCIDTECKRKCRRPFIFEKNEPVFFPHVSTPPPPDKRPNPTQEPDQDRYLTNYIHVSPRGGLVRFLRHPTGGGRWDRNVTAYDPDGMQPIFEHRADSTWSTPIAQMYKPIVWDVRLPRGVRKPVRLLNESTIKELEVRAPMSHSVLRRERSRGLRVFVSTLKDEMYQRGDPRASDIDAVREGALLILEGMVLENRKELVGG